VGRHQNKSNLSIGMPRRTKKDEDPEDLQTFLNNFHKEIEGNSDEKVVNTILEAISAEAIDLDENGAEAGGSKPMEEAEADLDHAEEAEEEEEDDEDKYFIDDEGNCYIKTTPKKQKELQKKLKQAAAKPGQATRSVVSTATNKCELPFAIYVRAFVSLARLFVSHQFAASQIDTESDYFEASPRTQGN